MLYKTLLSHRRKAILRNPAFTRNKITGILLGVFILFFAGNLVFLSLTLPLSIGIFNRVLPYLFIADFSFKYLFKSGRSLRLISYLTLPIRRRQLFDYLLDGEFTSLWNLYLPLLLIPFACKTILPGYGFPALVIYIIYMYLISLISSMAARAFKLLAWMKFLLWPMPFLLLAALIGSSYWAGVSISNFAAAWLGGVLDFRLRVWLDPLWVLFGLRVLNLGMMRPAAYLLMEGKTGKVRKRTVPAHELPFMERFGKAGYWAKLEWHMIWRSPRLRIQYYLVFPLILIQFINVYFSNGMMRLPGYNLFILFFMLYSLGLSGGVMGQFMFSSESAFFDGLISRPLSILDILKGKYLLYTAISSLTLLLALIPVALGLLDFLELISIFFYAVGFLYFIMFQNVIYNKSHMDLAASPWFNYSGLSGNSYVITLFAIIVPIALAIIVRYLCGKTAESLFMLLVGLAFTLTAKRWLAWTARRFLRRKYANMAVYREQE
ncbi:MAG: DUF5687 family protein [Tannerella sp.]|jgi:hypothetical protein|nr:DUF5687 family protein [Tannerella sp.]